MRPSMREDTRRRLERALWQQRLKWVGAGLAGIAAVAAGLYFTGLDASVETQHVAGSVTAVGPLNGTSTMAVEEGLSVDVKLDDGRLVHVMVLKAHAPNIGDHIEIAEHKHGSGRITFTWK